MPSKNCTAKEASDTFRIHTDFPALNKDGDMVLDFFYSSDSLFTGFLQVQFYLFQNERDSILVLNKQNGNFVFKKGTNKSRIDFSATDKNTSCNPQFYEILQRTESLPPGSYKVFLTAQRNEKFLHTVYFHEVDSNLGASSPVRRDINKSLAPNSKSFLGMRLKNEAARVSSSGAGKALSNAKNKVDKAAKKRGLTSVYFEKNGKTYIDLFYQDWFAGRYEAKKNETLSKQISQNEKLNQSGNFSAVSNNEPDHPSLFSQYKKQNTQKKDDEICGEISMTTNVSNGQEQYSGVDNNYMVLKGQLELPICNIPVQMEGLYTTQDNKSEIKSSYFKVHYDVEKMKDDLSKSMKSYNNKFAETKSKGVGMEQIYRTSISNLEGQRYKVQNEINSEAGVNKPGNIQATDEKLKKEVGSDLQRQEKDTAGLQQNVANSNDTDLTARKDSNGATYKASGDELKTKSSDAERKVEEKRKRLEALNKKIEKYKLLLVQCENTNHFDSLVGYNKTKDVSNQSDLTYKQMAKRSESMLPDGQAKGFLAGVTKLDAGTFSKTESQYTMSGQQMKGLDFGYDVGFCETGVAVGKTEYVGRDGGLDKYTFYSGKATFKPFKAQKISLIYYGYTPDHNMIAGDAFFKNANISGPSFFEPVHIISTNYSGSISKWVQVSAEAATSIKGSDNTVVPAYSMLDKMAYHFTADGNIPKTTLSFQGTYDNTEKGFENNTLPILLNGTQQYKLSGKNQFFHSFLTVGIEYNRLVQNNFYSNGTSTRWGFDIKTNSKRYPNISLSYKPFTTFNSYTDTMNIPQRPLIGAVWTGKLSYQIKHHDKSVRFSVIYNKSMTTMDTTKYGSNLIQASTIYSDKIMTTSASVGYTQTTGTNVIAVPTAPNDMSFLSLGLSYKLNKNLTATGGQDFGMANFGFCKYSASGGIMYRFEKRPLTARMNFRFSDFELNQGSGWQQLYSGSIDLSYRFKSKTGGKNNF